MRAPKGVTGQELQQQLEELYHHPELQLRQPQDDPLVPLLYERWVGNDVNTTEAQALLHTEYHTREKTLAAQVTDW